MHPKNEWDGLICYFVLIRFLGAFINWVFTLLINDELETSVGAFSSN